MAEKGDSDETIARKLSEVSRDLMEYLKEHYQEANLSAAAEYLHFHPNYLCSVLKKETGKTFKELVTEVLHDGGRQPFAEHRLEDAADRAKDRLCH